MLLDQSVGQQAPQPMIECLPRALRLIELHEFVELIACGESGTEDLLQQRMSRTGLSWIVPFP